MEAVSGKFDRQSEVRGLLLLRAEDVPATV